MCILLNYNYHQQKLTVALPSPPATTEGLDRGDNSEDAKTGPATAAPMMVAFKNGMQALHLTVPTTPRTLSHSQGMFTDISLSHTHTHTLCL